MAYDFQRYIGIPFKDHGRSIEGVDCWGLVHLFYKEQLNIELPTYLEVYEDVSEKENLQSIIRQEKEISWRRVPRGQQESGDVVLLRVLGAEYHVGIVVDKTRMIHTISQVETCLESYSGVLWSRRMEGIYRYVG